MAPADPEPDDGPERDADSTTPPEVSPDPPSRPGPAGAVPAAPLLARARWVGAQPCWNPEQGVVAYGEAIVVSPEQLADPNTTAIPWEDSWTPDPVLAAMCAAAMPADPEEG